MQIKKQNCRIIANILEKRAKAGEKFDIWDPEYCIGAACKEYIRNSKRYSESKVVCEAIESRGYFGFADAITILLGLPYNQIGYGGTSLWRRYFPDSYKNPSASDAAKMLHNLASGEWNTTNWESVEA